MEVLFFLAGFAACAVFSACVVVNMRGALESERMERKKAESAAEAARLQVDNMAEMLRVERKWRQLNTEAVNKLAYNYGQFDRGMGVG